LRGAAMKYPMMKPPASNEELEKFVEYEFLEIDGEWTKKRYVSFDKHFSNAVELPRPKSDDYRYFMGWDYEHAVIQRVKKVKQ
jgi:hypothetical protein